MPVDQVAYSESRVLQNTESDLLVGATITDLGETDQTPGIMLMTDNLFAYVDADFNVERLYVEQKGSSKLPSIITSWTKMARDKK